MIYILFRPSLCCIDICDIPDNIKFCKSLISLDLSGNPVSKWVVCNNHHLHCEIFSFNTLKENTLRLNLCLWSILAFGISKDSLNWSYYLYELLFFLCQPSKLKTCRSFLLPHVIYVRVHAVLPVRWSALIF